jgi:hypothetical protein
MHDRRLVNSDHTKTHVRAAPAAASAVDYDPTQPPTYVPYFFALAVDVSSLFIVFQLKDYKIVFLYIPVDSFYIYL